MITQQMLLAYGGVTPSPSLRFTGQYTVDFAGTNSATVTVPAIDLGPASPTKQILVIAHSEVPIITGITIDAVAAAYIADVGQFTYLFSQTYAGSGPFDIVVTLSATSTEIGAIEVYEVDNSSPLYQGVRAALAAAGTSGTLPFRIPNNGLYAAGCIDTTDTASITWSGLTSDCNADVGAYRASSASDTTLAVGNEDNDTTVTVSTSSTFIAMGLTVNPNIGLVSGGLRVVNSVSGSGSTATFTSPRAVNFTDLGSFKLFAFISMEANVTVTGVTFNGNAMALVGSIINTTPNPDLVLYCFSIDVTQAGPSGNIVVTASGSIAGINVGGTFVCIYNLGSVGAVETVSGNGTGNAVTPDVAEGGMILAYHIRATDTQTVTWTGADEVADTDIGTHRLSFANYPFAAAETGRTIQAVGLSGEYCTMAFAVNP